VPAERSSAAASPTASIVDYIKMGGDRAVVVPNGTYRGGEVNAPHPQTSGPYKGWLVLQAKTRGKVVIDLSGGPLELSAGTSRVMFVGFSFINGSVRAYGHDIAFWYTEHTFPATVWAAQAPDKTHPELGTYRAPRTVYVDKDSAQDVSFYGSDVHDTGTAFMVSSSRDFLLDGVTVERLTDDGLDPNDVVHPDAIGGVAGDIRNLTVRDSWIKGRIVIEDGAGEGGSTGGPVKNMLFQNTWVSNSPSAGFIFTADRKQPPWGIFGTRVDVRSWDQKAGIDRLDQVNGKAVPANSRPGRINVVDQNVATDAPPSGAIDPAAQWRAAHPYDSWAALFGFTARPSSGGGGGGGNWLGIAAITAAALAVIAVVIFVLRRRRRASLNRTISG
jgi:hypothetical protein